MIRRIDKSAGAFARAHARLGNLCLYEAARGHYIRMDGDDYSVHPVVIGRGAWTWSLIWIDPLQQPIGWSAAPTETPAPCLLTASTRRRKSAGDQSY